MSAKQRTQAELENSVDEWINKKFHLPRKQELRQALFPEEWSYELVVNKIKHPQELECIRGRGILVHRLRDIVAKLERDDFIIRSAAGADLVDLVRLDSSGSSY